MSNRPWEFCHCVSKFGKCPACGQSTAYASDAVHYIGDHWHWPCLLDRLTERYTPPPTVEEPAYDYFNGGPVLPYIP